MPSSARSLWAPPENLDVLDFDIENRPLSYMGGDWTTGEITAISWSWMNSTDVHVALLGEMHLDEILSRFLDFYEVADMVTGHYIRKHDLPVIQGAMLELGFGPLSKKMVLDTKLDLVSAKHQSLSQESLSAMLGLDAPKIHMTQADWREANRLTARGLELTRKRVTGDIRQHKQLYRELTNEKLLKPPSLWTPKPRGR